MPGDLIVLLIEALSPGLLGLRLRYRRVPAERPADRFSLTTSNDTAAGTVLMTPANDGMTHVSPQIAALDDGNVVVVWRRWPQLTPPGR